MESVLIFAGKKLGTAMARKFTGHVIEKWTRYRAENFFAGLLEALSSEVAGNAEPHEVEQKLDAILSDERHGEALFDAYRSVCFSKSRELGPRIIGLLTGLLVLEQRTCSPDEDQVFQAAELLSDLELYSFFKEYRGYVGDVGQRDLIRQYYPRGIPVFEEETLVLPWRTDERGTNGYGSPMIETTPLDLGRVLGPWAGRLETIGMITSHVYTSQKHERKRLGDELITEMHETIKSEVRIHSAAKLLAHLVEKSIKSSNYKGE